MNHKEAVKHMLRNGNATGIAQYQKFQNLTDEQMDRLLAEATDEVKKEKKQK